MKKKGGDVTYNIPEYKIYETNIPKYYDATKLYQDSSFKLKGGNNIDDYTSQFNNNFLLNDLNNNAKYKPLFDNINIQNVPKLSYFGLGGDDQKEYINKLINYIIKESYIKFTKKNGGDDNIYLKMQDLNIKEFQYLPPQTKIT